jgi:HPt (histidine-containing phosphotransfer) domain-containing protein
MMSPPTAAEPLKLEAPIDVEAYRRLGEIMEEELPTIVAEFIESTDKLLREIVLAEIACNALQIKKRAHNVKSSSAVLGALQLSAIARELERRAGDGTLEFPCTFGQTLQTEFARVRTELQRLADPR